MNQALCQPVLMLSVKNNISLPHVQLLRDSYVQIGGFYLFFSLLPEVCSGFPSKQVTVVQSLPGKKFNWKLSIKPMVTHLTVL